MSEPTVGERPAGTSVAHTLSAGESEEIDRRCDRFEAAWRAGTRPRHEDHLTGDGPFRATPRDELIAVELEWRRRGDRAEPGDAETVDVRPGVLESLGAGAIPRVLLRDTDGGPEPPVHRPVGGDAGAGSRYRIDGEIARGGMGVILKGRDPDLGRDVAIKVLRDDFRDNEDMVRRFVEEAQIGGQLQHPGVVPIYEMGTLGDRRPFFSMKLVKGDTLAKLLAGRDDPASDLPRFLAIFGSVAQTVAYAHARGVIHRDLKPSNVMVGSFGEVQVMDWGLAKVLTRGGIADDASAGKIPKEDTVIATARSGSGDSDLSRAGSVLGTPSFMAPEQACGEVERVDERADVFALGSILCEVLTGLPAFTGRTSGEILRKAALGDLADAFARLDACGADADLIALSKHCLAREPEDRPASAGAVSDRLTAYLSGVQEKLRRAELESVEERARRRVTTVTAASLILLSLAIGGGYAWNQHQKAERLAKTARGVDEALADASRLRGEALSAAPGDVGRWSAALGAAKRAESVLAEGEADATLKARVDALMAGVKNERAAAAEKARQIEIDRVLLDDLESVRGNRAMHRDLKQADFEYAEVFRNAGLDLDTIESETSGRWLAVRTDPIEMAGYLDDWAFVRRRSGRAEADWMRIVAAARVGDPDPWRDALRSKFGKNDPASTAEFHRMAEDAKLEDQPAPGLLLLARQLKFGCGDGTGAAQVLRRASARYPGDFRVHFELAQAPGTTEGPSIALFPYPEEAARHLTAALGIRPRSVTTHQCLSAALLSYRKLDEAVAECREAVRLKPDDAGAHAGLGNALRWNGKLDEAEAECREAVRLKPEDSLAHGILGLVLSDQGKLDKAAAALSESVRLRPADSDRQMALASLLQRKGDYKGARIVLRKAREQGVRLVPDPYYPEEWIAKVEPLAALEVRLPAILIGKDHPKDGAEQLDLTQMCYNKKLYAAAARFWSEAMDEDPKIAARRNPQHRYNAACCAALAGSGWGKDETPPDDAAKAKLRGQALQWLRAELVAWSKLLETATPQVRTAILGILHHWQKDADLAGVRDADALARLPEAERKDWQTLWADVQALLDRAERKAP